MLYAIIGRDRPGAGDARRRARPQHLERIQSLVDQARLVLAGPLPAIDAPDPGPAGMAGSLIVAEFDSQEAARAWAEADPYCIAGVFDEVKVHPFLKVLP